MSKPLSLGRYFTPKEDGKFTALWFYVVPLDEHSTRVINHAVIVQPLPGLVKRLAAARPRWIDHLLLNEIFDGDMAYLSKACTIVTAWVSCCLLARLNVFLRCMQHSLPGMDLMALLLNSAVRAVCVCRQATTPSRGMGLEGRGRRTTSFLQKLMGAAQLSDIPCCVLHCSCQSSVPL